MSEAKASQPGVKPAKKARPAPQVVLKPEFVSVDPAAASGANSDDESAAAAEQAPPDNVVQMPQLGRPAPEASPIEGPGPSFRDDPRLDRRIIEGMLGDREIFLEAMAQEGFSSAAVLRRAAELGLSEAMVRQVKGVAADLAGERPGRRGAPPSLGPRTCLQCDRIFLSSGPNNRLCMRCRGGDAGMAQL